MRCLFFLSLFLSSGLVIAEERFYTTVDAQGHIQVIKSDQSAKAADKKPSNNPIAKEPVPAAEVKAKAEPVSEAKPKSGQDTYQVGTETYIDSELLEKKDFNLGDKKRFYYLPDGSLGSQTIETKAGIIETPKVSTAISKPMSFIASAYQVLPSDGLKSMYAVEQGCLGKKYLAKHSRLFKASNNVWVRPQLTQDKLEPDVVFDLSSLPADTHTLRFVSFASSHKQPKFYLPVIVFVDANGCQLSGVWQYWSQAHAATDRQYASVDGLITIPEHSAYILSYRPVDTLKADIPSTHESGSFVVETY